ncbi:MAG: hypothetical protein M0Q53_09310 [Prolixibacteraceae bacterium]|jgi:hypothetical protein|nr:hypothetical protein [Prolixibacteraceae bacterium]
MNKNIFVLLILVFILPFKYLKAYSKTSDKNPTSEVAITINNTDKAVIVIGQHASLQESNIVHLLQQKIREKSQLLIPIIEEKAFSFSQTEFNTIIIPGWENSSKLLAGTMRNLNLVLPDKREGFQLFTSRYQSKNIVLIGGSDELGILFGEGKLLRTSNYKEGQMTVHPLNINEIPKDDQRGIYFAIHDNNWYEDIPDMGKIKDLIDEQGLWGSNILWLWFDISQYHKSPFENSSDSRSKWTRIKQVAKAANDMGMKVGFTEIANAGYLDQVTEKLKATGGDPPEGLLCPHANNDEAMNIMESNYRELYRDLKKSGILVNAFDIGFYDRGGCHCDLCRPWVKTGITFIGARHAKTIKEYYPNCDFHINDWHFDIHDGVNEIEWTKDYLKTSKPDWINGIYRSDRSVWDSWNGLNPKYDVATFFDISMIGGWGGFGANPFPNRLDRFFKGMLDNGIKGGMAYTEGIFDDINKVLVLQHHWGICTSDSILKEYAKWYLGADKEAQQSFANLMFDLESEWSDIYGNWWGQFLDVKPQLAVKKRFDKLEALLAGEIKESWRWMLVHARVNLAQLAIEISGLNGSGYNEFYSEIGRLISDKEANKIIVKKLVKEQEVWLTQKTELFDKEYQALYYGIYEGMKNGMYGSMAPDPTRFIKGFNRGEKWKELFGNNGK